MGDKQHSSSLQISNVQCYNQCAYSTWQDMKYSSVPNQNCVPFENCNGFCCAHDVLQCVLYSDAASSNKYMKMKQEKLKRNKQIVKK